MDHFQCSAAEAADRLQALIQNLIEDEQIPPPRLDSPPRTVTPPIILPIDPPIPSSPPPNEEPQTATRKKVVYIDFDVDAPIADRVPHHLYEYAVRRIEDMEYVELWYFSKEGCLEASKVTLTAADDTYGLLKTDTGLAFCSTKASKASPNAIPDEQLAWDQITMGRHALLKTARRVGWPDKHIFSLATFYINLEALMSDGYNTQTLILYHAVVRRQWHKTMKGRGTPFNLSIFNQRLFDTLDNQIMRDQMVRKIFVLNHNAHELTTHPHSHPPPAPYSPCNAMQRYTTPPPSHQTPPTPRNALKLLGISHRALSPSQATVLSRRDATEVPSGSRDRGRERRRERGTGKPRSSRSRSPRRKSPNNRFRKNISEHKAHTLSACQVCLSRKRHPIRKCQASTLWNGQHKMRCSRTEDGRIVDGKGRILCSNWNQSSGCDDKSARHIHECSGCGETSHGAQECGLAEKAQTADAARR